MKVVKWSIVVLLLLPVSAFAFYKPVRVLMPEVFGVSCHEQNICVDDPSQIEMAVVLVNSAKRNLEQKWNLSIGEPKIIFCSTEKCQSTFGHTKTAGYTFGNFGILIQPRGWKEHYVAHELIHFWQAEKFGSLVFIFGESWVTEGMAYELSNDPRSELHEPYESYRKKFSEWYRTHADEPLGKAITEVL